MNKKIDKLIEQENDLLDQLNKIKDERREAERQANEQRREELKPLAQRAHSLLCLYNHTDGCGWGYEEDSKLRMWDCTSHKMWLDHFEKLVHGDKRYGEVYTVKFLTDLLNWVELIPKEHKGQMLWFVRSSKIMP